ncbi:DnaB-like helicase N-terminal domain-containing protein, partial [Salmonella enterica subsp. enterica serovar Paratyphi A]
ALPRESPNNIEAEQALLGALFANNDLVGSLEFLRPSHFFEPLHRRIYDTCIELIKLGKTANPVTVKSFLPADEKVGGMTVAQYLARLAAEAVTVINAVDYARAIEDMSRRRRLIVAADHLREAAFDAHAEADPQSLGDMAIDEISAACETDAETLGAISMGDAITSAIDMANGAFMKEGQ